ncbi:urease accessory UreF family protein [Ciceribacter sp. L1K22]|uniref:urease accessory protein UreF n=1 Tax=Ciceribacter sp. L1K22 TaxID=2820275 RepID=UPI001FF0295D|nr:urease accessory UreF family protein [Ciceribacter sp. L1K22]
MVIIMGESPPRGDIGERQALLRLMAWLSPAFPVGTFAYSGGLERAVADRLVSDGPSLRDWVHSSLEIGATRTDALFLSLAHRCQEDAVELAALADLATSLAGSRERHAESLGLGSSFVTAVRAWPEAVLDRLPDPAPYPVAVGAVAGAHGVPVEWALLAFLQAYIAQATSVAIRFGVIGQVEAVAIQSATEDLLKRIAEVLVFAEEGDLGSGTMIGDIMSLRHETQPVRLFRS